VVDAEDTVRVAFERSKLLEIEVGTLRRKAPRAGGGGGGRSASDAPADAGRPKKRFRIHARDEVRTLQDFLSTLETEVRTLRFDAEAAASATEMRISALEANAKRRGVKRKAAVVGESASTAIVLDRLNSHGQTQLYVAAMHGETARVAALLQAGARVDQTGHEWSATPLIAAAEQGHQAVVVVLLEAGASVDRLNRPGFLAFCMGGAQPCLLLQRTGIKLRWWR